MSAPADPAPPRNWASVPVLCRHSDLGASPSHVTFGVSGVTPCQGRASRELVLGPVTKHSVTPGMCLHSVSAGQAQADLSIPQKSVSWAPRFGIESMTCTCPRFNHVPRQPSAWGHLHPPREPVWEPGFAPGRDAEEPAVSVLQQVCGPRERGAWAPGPHPTRSAAPPLVFRKGLSLRIPFGSAVSETSEPTEGKSEKRSRPE